jgi:hypothetical protein
MWNQTIVRELALVLVIKLAALYVIWLAFFHQPDERELTQHEIGQFLLGETHSAVHSQHQPKQTTGVRDGY